MSDKEKNWGVRDTSGLFGPEPFLASTEEEARELHDGDPLSVIVRRPGPGSAWEVVAP